MESLNYAQETAGQGATTSEDILGALKMFGSSWINAKYATDRPPGSVNIPGDSPREVKTDTTNAVKGNGGGVGKAGLWVVLLLVAAVVGFLVGKGAGAVWGALAALAVVVVGYFVLQQMADG